MIVRRIAKLAAAAAIGLALLGMVRFAVAQPHVATNPDLATLCNQAVIYDTAANGATLLVTGITGEQIYVCGFTFWSAGTTNVDLVYGTGATCGTGTQQVTPAFRFTAQSGIVDHPVIYQGLTPAPSANNLCINSSATPAVAVEAIIYYTQF